LSCVKGLIASLAGSGPLVIVGASVGGSCALEIALLAPDRVAAVVLIGAKASHLPEPLVRDEVVRTLAYGGMVEAWPRHWEPLFGVGADPDAIENARQIAFRQPVDHIINGVDAFHNRADRAEFVTTWSKPLVVVSGSRDRTPSPAVSSELAASTPGGTYRLVEGSGHYVSLEQPAEIARIVREVRLDL